ncbi:MAG: 3-deoxy-8-phosphooctulonate synthase [Myxococcaceae bacterium]|nr:3-deoxy-8-phosphooctulonate synthase [Myxococcaceae bacterium]
MFELIAGPCVIESEQHAFQMAMVLKSICSELKIPLIFKASFDKANRTELNGYRGPGLKKGLAVLQTIKQELGLRVTSDIHESWQAEPAAAILDVLQIPAFLCRQTDLLRAAGQTGRIVNIKKGQFLSPSSMQPAIEKVRSTGNSEVWITERGSCFGYNDWVVDFRAFDLFRPMGCPIVFDASHSAKAAQHIETLARAALVTGAQKLFLEVHEQPENALSDGKTSYPLEKLKPFLERLQKDLQK